MDKDFNLTANERHSLRPALDYLKDITNGHNERLCHTMDCLGLDCKKCPVMKARLQLSNAIYTIESLVLHGFYHEN